MVDYQLARDVDLVVVLGRDAQLDPLPDTQVQNWDTDWSATTSPLACSSFAPP
ncbi:MAG: hypothetical protein ACSLFA_02955 [Mycobacterium sp.]